MTWYPNTNNVIWAAQAGSQELFFSIPYEVFEAILEGTRGGGKTDCLILDFARECGQGFGAEWRGMLFKRTNPELQDVWEKCRKWLPRMFPGVRFRESPYKEVIWPDGEKLTLRHMPDVKAYLDVHGSNLTWLGWEELTNWADPKVFLKCMSLIRSTHLEVARRMRVRATTNPGGPGHNWVRDRYQLPHKRNQIIHGTNEALARKWLSEDDVAENTGPPRLRMAIFSDIRENKILMRSNPGYLQGLKEDADSEAQYKAWVYGDWNIVSGGMFDDVWSQQVHFIRPFNIPQDWKIDRSFDWGETKPFSAGYWAQSDGSDVRLNSGRWVSTVPGDLFRINEWYGWNGKPNEGMKLTSTEIAEGLIEREIGWGIYDRVVAGPADTAIFTGTDGKASIAAEMAKEVRRINGRSYRGITWTRARKGPGSRKSGWRTLRTLFKNGHRADGRPRERPGLFVFDICDQFARTMPVLPRDEKDSDDVLDTAEDHIADESRYRGDEVSHLLTAGTTRGV